jgi:hypothetical protein
MRARGSESGVKNKTPKLPETREYLGKIGFSFSLTPIFLTQNSNFFNGFPISSTAFQLFQWLSTFFNRFPLSKKSEKIFFNGFPLSEKSEKIFFNGFPISSTAFRLLQRLSAFFNGFPLSEKSKKIFFNGFPISSMAFRFLICNSR